MKNFKIFIKSGIAVFILFFSFNLMGSSITSVEIVPVENQKVFLLTVKTTGNGNIDMRIKDSDGQAVFSDQQQSLSSFAKRINLNALQDGDYTFELEDELFVNVTSFTIGESGLVVKDENSAKYCKPIINWNQSSKNLDINWLLNEKGTVRILIADEASNIVHGGKIKNQLAATRRYSFSDLGTGIYYVIVKNRDRSYTKKIQIK